ncbi:MAG: pyridoxamine 5'-phosphate oxidase family protein [Bacteroidales bacterium]
MKAIEYTSREKIDEIINACTYCIAAVNGEDGFPYSFPMNFVYHEGRFYLHSAPEGTHLSLIEKSNRIVLTFVNGSELVFQHERVACSHSMRSDSVVVKGYVSFISCMEKKKDILNVLMQRFIPGKDFLYSVPSLQNVKVWVVDIQDITAKGVGLTYEEFKALSK